MKLKYKALRGNRVTTLLAMILVMAVVICGCGGGPKISASAPVEKQDFLLNTVCNIKIQGYEGSREEAEALLGEAYTLARELENKLSRTISGSDVYKINQANGEPVDDVDPRVMEVLAKGEYYEELSKGRFDIHLGRLTALWDFSSGKNVVPEEDQIQAVLHDPNPHLDLGAIAKGYIVEQVSLFLKEQGVTSGIVDFGGNISCVGAKEGGAPWYIGIKRPFGADDSTANQSATIGIVEVHADGSAVTSGTYERKFEENGILYHHILDPDTGYPCDTDVNGVTIIGSSSTDCDALSTICLLLGKDAGMELIESIEGVEAVFVTKDGAVHCTSGVVFEAL